MTERRGATQKQRRPGWRRTATKDVLDRTAAGVACLCVCGCTMTHETNKDETATPQVVPIHILPRLLSVVTFARDPTTTALPTYTHTHTQRTECLATHPR